MGKVQLGVGLNCVAGLYTLNLRCESPGEDRRAADGTGVNREGSKWKRSPALTLVPLKSLERAKAVTTPVAGW